MLACQYNCVMGLVASCPEAAASTEEGEGSGGPNNNPHRHNIQTRSTQRQRKTSQKQDNLNVIFLTQKCSINSLKKDRNLWLNLSVYNT